MAGKELQKRSQAFRQSSRLNWLRSDSVTKSVLLGNGRYATVWLGRFQGKPCAVKEPRTDAAKQLDKELEIFSLESLMHPNVIGVMGVWEDPSKPGAPPCIVMEYCEMSLPEYLRANKSALKRSHGSTSATEIKIRILLDVIRGLIYLHQKDVFHGDLRSSNVLIQQESKESDIPVVKISDYGFSQHVDPLTKARRAEILCEAEFLPPEMLTDSSSTMKNATLTPQVDVFMFGDVALETATLEPVSCAKKDFGKKVILTEVERRTESFRKIVQLGDKDTFIHLIKSCLAEKPEQRMSTTDIENTLQSHLGYYQGNPNASERQDKAAECEKLRAEKRTEWKRVVELQRQLKAFEDCKKQMKKQLGEMENRKEGQAQTVQDTPNVLLTLKDRDFITAQLTDSCLTASDEVSALTVEKDVLLKQVHKLEQEKKELREQMEHCVTKNAKLQSQTNSSEADRDRLMQAEEGWTKERLCLKKQLQDMQDELSRLKQSSAEKQSAMLKKMDTFKGTLQNLHNGQAVAGLKSAVALCKESVTAQSVALQEDLEEIKKAFLRAVLEREEASQRAQQVFKDQARYESDTAKLREQVLKQAQKDYNSSQMVVEKLEKTVGEQAAKIDELEKKLKEAQAVEAGLWKKMEGQTSEMKKLKEDQDKSRQRHENTLLSAIDVLTEHHRTAFMDEAEATPHPINGPQDILSALDGKLDAKWNRFGLYLGVDTYAMETIETDRKGATDCMMHLVSQWMDHRYGTGVHPRTWETVVRAVKKTGLEGFAKELAKSYLS